MFRINRNIVECKDKQAMKSIADSIVLIETLWNVKNSFGSSG